VLRNKGWTLPRARLQQNSQSLMNFTASNFTDSTETVWRKNYRDFPGRSDALILPAPILSRHCWAGGSFYCMRCRGLLEKPTSTPLLFAFALAAATALSSSGVRSHSSSTEGRRREFGGSLRGGLVGERAEGAGGVGMASPSRSPGSDDDDRDGHDETNGTVVGGKGLIASSSSSSSTSSTAALASGQVDEVSRFLAAHKRTPSVFVLDLDSTL
jgi:hypothetical protein